MSILSLQAIIQKYGAKYGIDTKAAIKDSAKDPVKDPGKGAAAGGAANDPKKADDGTAKIPPADSLNLSPAAKDFLASHTGALGKFEMPNVLDAFMSAMDGTDQGGSGSGNSLLDFLKPPGKDDQGFGASGTGASDSANPFAIGNDASKSLLDFL